MVEKRELTFDELVEFSILLDGIEGIHRTWEETAELVRKYGDYEGKEQEKKVESSISKKAT